MDTEASPPEPSDALSMLPWLAAAERVTMLITPFMALVPHRAAPGPRMTSMRSMSSITMSWVSHSTPENRGE